MTDNTEEKHLDTPTNMESENISNDTIPITETENIPQNQETENMEVHHHPKVEHKSLKGYLLEGLMIFLAVTMGYVAENIREHFVEKEREEQYIKSFLEDLTNDEQNLPRLVNSLNRQIKEADSLQLLLPNLDTKTRANNCYLFLRSLIRQQDISLFIKDRTIVQLKNTGGMRLLQNKNILDSLLSYYQKIEFVKYLQNMLLEMKMLHKTLSAPLLNNADYHKLIDSTDHLINPQENLYLRTLDPVAINNCLLNVSDIKGLSSVIKIRIIDIKESARNLKHFIAKEYHLKNE